MFSTGILFRYRFPLRTDLQSQNMMYLFFSWRVYGLCLLFYVTVVWLDIKFVRGLELLSSTRLKYELMLSFFPTCQYYIQVTEHGLKRCQLLKPSATYELHTNHRMCVYVSSLCTDCAYLSKHNINPMLIGIDCTKMDHMPDITCSQLLDEKIGSMGNMQFLYIILSGAYMIVLVMRPKSDFF